MFYYKVEFGSGYTEYWKTRFPIRSTQQIVNATSIRFISALDYYLHELKERI